MGSQDTRDVDGGSMTTPGQSWVPRMSCRKAQERDFWHLALLPKAVPAFAEHNVQVKSVSLYQHMQYLC